MPILDRCENWFVGRVLDRFDAGDHDAFLLEPVAGESGDQDEFTLPPREADRPRPRGLMLTVGRLTAFTWSSNREGVAFRGAMQASCGYERGPGTVPRASA